MLSRFRGKRWRLVAVLVLVALAATASWLRTPVLQGDLADLRLVALDHATEEVTGFRVTGLWDMQSGDARFGGYSALLLGDDGRFLAFSDRGRRLSFGAPGLAMAGEQSTQAPDEGMGQDLFDIESATRDPASGTYWLGYEGEHAVHRYTAENRADGHLLLAANWPQNGGAESLIRLADERFVLLSEEGAQLCLFAGDPVAGADQVCTPVAWPEPGYAPTDAAQLPDGRLLVLMRRVDWTLPPRFDSLLAVGELPGEGEEWQPDLALRLEALLPHENYEGMAVRSLPDGHAALWLIADDNFSAFQRTLLARLVFDPAAIGHEKAREGEADAR